MLGHKELETRSAESESAASSRDSLQGTLCVNETVERKSNGDDEFERLAELWPKLSAEERAALLTLAAALGSREGRK